jgi:DNA-binding IclR family transcriptional regulator
MSYPTVKSVVKALQILEMLIEHSAQNKVLTLADVREATGILPSTARNLLRTLEECGYAQRRSHGSYEEGERCHSMLRTGGIIRKLREVSTPIIEQTSRDLSESLLLVSIFKGNRLELVRRQAVDDRKSGLIWQDNSTPYQLRTTRVILAWFSPEQLSFFIERNGLPPEGDWPECRGCLEGLEGELKQIRFKGGCNEQHGQLAAIAVPILSSSNEVLASIGCYAPLERTDVARAAGIFSLMQICADRIRDELS